MKALNINAKRTGFPITINGVELFFDASLEGIERYESKITEAQAMIADIPDTGNVVEDKKTVVRMSFDSIFGDGTFDNLYQVLPDITALQTVFFDVVKGIDERTAEYIKEYNQQSDELLEMYQDKKSEIEGQ